MTLILAPTPGWVAATDTNLDVALATTLFGPVFPCKADKTPATANGFKDATTDESQIRRWWDGHYDYLVGMPTSGLIVVDLDTKPNTPCTWTWWRTTCERNEWPWDRDPLVFTPGNGVHVYFEAPTGVEIRNSASKLAPGVDIRAEGGYVIAPGSKLVDGNQYELANYPEGVHEAPEWLVTAIKDATAPPVHPTPAVLPTSSQGTRYGLSALEAELGRLALAPQGQRNDTLVRAAYRAGQIVAGGQLDPNHVSESLYAVAIRIGLTDSETIATIRSGLSQGVTNPRKPTP